MHSSELFDPTPSQDTPIACDLSALDDPGAHKSQTQALFDEREDTVEVDRGVAMRFSGTMDNAKRILNFVGRERQCCPFLTFEITFEPEKRGIWLFLGGDQQAEAYIQGQFEAQ